LAVKIMEEEEYEALEARLLMAAGQFESRWDKAWNAWLKTHDVPADEAADMVNSSPYDKNGTLLPAVAVWYRIYGDMKTAVEKEFDVKIDVDVDGCVSAVHTLPGGDTITVP